ncbi:hypothetical protein TNCV_2539151 [Trichonephila clavipes]|nr:hypothetical protein TNCV_2539151 [Trichonephila clavipes]
MEYAMFKSSSFPIRVNCLDCVFSRSITNRKHVVHPFTTTGNMRSSLTICGWRMDCCTRRLHPKPFDSEKVKKTTIDDHRNETTDFVQSIPGFQECDEDIENWLAIDKEDSVDFKC